MPLPMSKSQVRKLGSRLRSPGPPSEEDLDQLATVLAAYDEALMAALDRLRSSGLEPARRLKNTGTIVEKLRRGEGTNLAAIQDLAGLRIVLGTGEGRDRQDECRDLVVSSFAAGEYQPRVYDRRVEPSHGYRAVHVVAEVAGVPVEIQIRTHLQHEWAQFFEKLADEVGRGIRYGGEPETLVYLLSDQRFDGSRSELRGAIDSLVGICQDIGDMIARHESLPPMPGPAEELLDEGIGRVMEVMRGLVEAVRVTMRYVRGVLAS